MPNDDFDAIHAVGWRLRRMKTMPDEPLPLATLRLHVEQTIKHLEHCKPWAYLDLQHTAAVLRRVLEMAERCQEAEAERDRLRAIVEEFAAFCDDSGWRNVAEELRKRKRDAAGPQGVQG